jgi:ribosomal protein S24E
MMSLKIIEQKKNPLMKVEEVKAVIEHAGKPTPKREDIMPSLENVLKKEKELILIDKIFTKRGKGESLLKVLVYDRKEDMPKKVEKAGKAKADAPEQKAAEKKA